MYHSPDTSALLLWYDGARSVEGGAGCAGTLRGG